MSSSIIFANGTIADYERVRSEISKEVDPLIIAADGGVQHCSALQLAPDLVIGDLDSLDEKTRADLEQKGVQIISFPRDKDQTDLELALQFAIRRYPDRILLFGLLGGRLDQTIANLLLLARPEWGSTQLITMEGPDTAYLVRGSETLQLTGETGEIISLISLTPQVGGVTTEGLRWPLKEAKLRFGSTLGVSNEFESTLATITFTEGVLLVVHRSMS